MSDITVLSVLRGEHTDKEVTVRGWLRSVRKSKKFSFLVLNDGSSQGMLQIVVDAELPNYDAVSSLLTGSSVEVKGLVVASQGRNQTVEMQAKEVTILGVADETYPLQKKATSLEFLRENAHLRVRTNTFGAVFRIRHALAFAIHQFYNDRGFFYVNTPIITASDAEGAGEMFQVTTMDLSKLPAGKTPDYTNDFFGTSTNLTVSGQLEAECLALGLSKVYTFGPTFRAENSNTARHLAEFWMVEPEVAFADLDDVALLASDFIKYLIGYVLEKCPDELEFLQSRYNDKLVETLKHVKGSDFVKITYTDAIEILKKNNDKFEFQVEWGSDLQSEHERFLTEQHFQLPVIVTDYPREIKAFYMKQSEDGKTVRAMDVLVPGIGEIIGGSQREDDYDRLVNRIKEIGHDPKEYWWYLDLRKHGSVVHSGFGLGFERLVMYVTGMSNVRDVIPFPRTPKSAEF